MKLKMKKLVDIIKFDRLDSLIRHAATGSPEKLAERLGISRGGLFNLIAFLKDEMHAPVYYNKNRCSYMYSFIPEFYLGFERERTVTSEKSNTYGKCEKSDKNGNIIKVEIEINENYFNLIDENEINEFYNENEIFV